MADPIVPPPVNPSPKARFMGVKGYVTAHHDLIVRDDFQRALDYALMEYQLRVAQSTDPTMSGSGHFKMVGALEFITVLKTLGEFGQPPAAKKIQTLDHTA